MSELMEIEDEILEDEDQKMGSLNHSIVQAQITGLLLADERFRVMVELSLDVKQTDLSQFGIKAKEELKPDVCLYSKDKIHPNESRDVLRMPEMPLLAIEVLSPRQGIDEILSKFHAYFALGIKSCWIVTPAFKSITVYSEPNDYKLFDVKGETEVVDETLDIHLSLKKVFDW